MTFKFVDLFAGLGGFHVALSQLGGECVFASELNPALMSLYELNHGIRPHGDIRECFSAVPAHDILCAGFPCQPFSKAGEQLGFDCPQWGNLFDYVTKIIRRCEPKYLLIENVPNLLQHDGGETWNRVRRKLEKLGYEVDAKKLSPHMFGIPQIRERLIIVGSRTGLDSFTWPITSRSEHLSIKSVLDRRPKEAKLLNDQFCSYLKAWQSLLSKLPESEALPSFPLWAMEFGATYPFESKSPFKQSPLNLKKYKGSFGKRISGSTWDVIEQTLPPYARSRAAEFPAWKIKFIQQNREFYLRNKEIIDAWKSTLQDFAPSFQKLEWNWKDGPRDIFKTVVQFRASGIRAKRPEASPALVALTASQVPVITWERRYMTIRECARLQSLDTLNFLPETYNAAFRALGNAVNADVIREVARRLLPQKRIMQKHLTHSRETAKIAA